MNILRLASFIAIIGAGQTLVIISGSEGIDLSAGSAGERGGSDHLHSDQR